MWILHAPNVHSGGGAVLLREWVLGFLDSPITARKKLVVHADARMDSRGLESERVTWVRVAPSVYSRIKAEIALWKWARSNPGAHVCCFGNLPPLLNLPGASVTVYFHNLNLLSLAQKHPIFRKFSGKVRLRLMLERAWLGATLKHAHRFFVQTSTTRNSLIRDYPSLQGAVSVVPFAPKPDQRRPMKKDRAGRPLRFIYISPADAHKNHETLIRAWQEVAQQIRENTPELWLTVEPKLLDDWKERYGLPATLKLCDRSKFGSLGELYAGFDALIYPSFYESFGLPLIEARQANLPILASDLEYVHEICAPVAAFDPTLAESIAEQVVAWIRLIHDSAASAPAGPEFRVLTGTEAVELWARQR